MEIKDRPTAEYEARVVASKVFTAGGADVPAGGLLYVEIVEVSREVAAPIDRDSPLAAVAALDRAAAEGFAEARIASAAAWADFWQQNDAAPDSADLLAARAKLFAASRAE